MGGRSTAQPMTRSAERSRFWRQTIETWRESNQSQADFCRDHKISRDQFVYWKRKLQQNDSGGMSGVSLVKVTGSLPSLLGVQPGRHEEDRTALEEASRLTVAAGRYRVEVMEGFDVDTLGRLLDVLEVR